MTTTKKMLEISAGTKGKGDKMFWNKIGVAFENRDGSHSLVFNFYPADPAAVLLVSDPEKKGEGGPVAVKEQRRIMGIQEYEAQGEKKSFWTQIGMAFGTKSGGWMLRLNYLPVDPNTRIQLRETRATERATEQAAQQATEEIAAGGPDDNLPF